MRLRRIAAAGFTLTTLLLAVACGDSAEALFSSDDGSADGGSLGSDARAVPNQPSADAGGSVGSASGVVILHAAAFPAFRLCFENYPELAPQPDTTVMPAANLVGVEVGSVVRLGPLERAPGMVYVVDQREVRATPDAPQARTCGELLADTDFFAVDRKYQLAGAIDAPLGVDRVHVLAITGCGGGSWLNELQIAPADCADWDATRGSLRARTLALLPTSVATETTLPVQVIHMSSLLESKRGVNETLEVTFGALATDGGAPLQQAVTSAPPLFDASAPSMLAVDQTNEATYGSHGFRIAYRSKTSPGAAPSFFADQTLADVQELSFPQTVPTTYYLAASNYALLLLGDPRIKRNYADGGVNPTFDPRRAVHLLAVPVKEAVDAGVAAAEDGGIE